MKRIILLSIVCVALVCCGIISKNKSETKNASPVLCLVEKK